MRLEDCHNTAGLRELAKKPLPGPIFHYIDGAVDVVSKLPPASPSADLSAA